MLLCLFLVYPPTHTLCMGTISFVFCIFFDRFFASLGIFHAWLAIQFDSFIDCRFDLHYVKCFHLPWQGVFSVMHTLLQLLRLHFHIGWLCSASDGGKQIHQTGESV